MLRHDTYGYALTTGDDAAESYNHGVQDLLRLRSGAVESVARSIVHDPGFALGHAALALFGHELCAAVDVGSRLRDAETHATGGTERERSHVHAVLTHVRGDSQPLIDHLRAYPRDALLLSIAVPTIAFAGVTEVPEEAWAIVENSIPAYGDDWWFTGLLAFIRQEQRRFDEAMDLSCRSLAEEPAAGHSAHARAHAHYETGDHEAGLAWMDGWVIGDGASTDSLTHFSWHAALHELSLGDLDAVRSRYDAQLRPEHGLGCRALVDSGSLLFRWAITPGSSHVPSLEAVATVAGRDVLERPATPFLAMHSAVTLLAIDDRDGLRGSAAGRHGTHTRRSARSWRRWRGRSCCCTTGDVRRRPTTSPASGATLPVSAGRTPSASWSRRSGSAPCCGRGGSTTHAPSSTNGSTGAARRATSAGGPRASTSAATMITPA